MKTVGIIGGIGPESTIEYYKFIINAYRERKKDGSYPGIIINSIDMKKMLDLIGSNRLDEAACFLTEEVKKLADAGADFGLLASNTPHIVFDKIQEKSAIPLISIVESACRAVKKTGLKTVCLLGTKFTMQGGFYKDTFSKNDISILVPGIEEQEYIHEKYMNELVKGIILDETRNEFVKVIEKMKNTNDIQGVILGGTELPLILRGVDAGIPFFDTTIIHVESAVEKMFS